MYTAEKCPAIKALSLELQQARKCYKPCPPYQKTVGRTSLSWIEADLRSFNWRIGSCRELTMLAGGLSRIPALGYKLPTLKGCAVMPVGQRAVSANRDNVRKHETLKPVKSLAVSVTWRSRLCNA